MPIISNDMYPLRNDMHFMSIQNKKMFCAYHTSQFLTNFCYESSFFDKQEQCLMPLCPSCIVQHTQQHFMQGKKPTYSNINQALTKSKQSCYCTIVSLQNYKKQNQKIFHYLSSLTENIHNQLEQKKIELFANISMLFKEYQARLTKQIKDIYIERNVYDKQQALNAAKFIDQEIGNLYERIAMLKGDDCLSALITFKAVDQQTYEDALTQFDQYFQKNRKAGKIQISFQQENLKILTDNLCDNLFNVQSIIQNFQIPVQSKDQQNQDNKSKRYGFNRSPDVQISRRTVQEKQNIENNSVFSPAKQSDSRAKLRMGSRIQQKHGSTANEMSFNGQNFAKKQQPIVRNVNDSYRPISLSNQISQESSKFNSEQGNRRLIRGFKRQQI